MSNRRLGIFLTVAALCLIGGVCACQGESHRLEKVESVEADCTHEGNLAYWRCLDCGAAFLDAAGKIPAEEVIVPALGHDYLVTKKIAPTCEEAGEERKVCTRCDDEKTETLPATGHFYQTLNTVSPSCNTAGEQIKFCRKCGDTKTIPLPALNNHTFGTDNVCKVCKLRCIPSEGLTYEILIERGMAKGYSVGGTEQNGNLILPYYYETLPVLEIGEEGFRDAEIQNFVCYAPLEKIGKRAFWNCVLLPDLKLPETLTVIGEEAFRACTSLEEIELPDSVTELGKRAFYACSRVSRLHLGKGVQKIGENCFWNMERLLEITVSEGNERYYSSGDCLIERGSEICLLGSSRSKIPNSVIEIAESAFLGRTGLERLEIPKSVKKIGDFAFRGCTDLKEILFEGTREEWEEIEKGKEWDAYTGEGFKVTFLGS